ncbi:ATP-binding protein [Mycobacterium sp. NPDC003449]
MFIYTAIRHVKRLVGTTGRGEPLFGGPYEGTRDLPVAAAAVFLACSIVAAGFTLGRVTGSTMGGLSLGVLGAGVVLYIGVKIIRRLRRMPRDASVQDWLTSRVDMILARPTQLSGANPFHPAQQRDKNHPLLAATRIVHGNIRDVGGKFWAEYRVPFPLPNGRVTDEHSLQVLEEHQLLFRVLLRHGFHIGLLKEPQTFEELLENSFTENERADEALDEIGMYADATVGLLEQLVAKAQDDASTWPSRNVFTATIYVGDDEAKAAIRRDEIISHLPFTWHLRPATPAQMYWAFYAHAVRGAELVPTLGRTDLPEALPDIEFDDGAISDVSLRRRFSLTGEYLSPVLKITTGNTTTYQAILTAKLPDVIDWPDTDIFSTFAHMEAPIDVAIRCSPKDRGVVEEENKKANTIITDNQDETAHLSSAVKAFSREEQLHQLYSEKLAEDPDLHSVTFNIFIAVGGRTPEDVAQLVESLNTTFSRSKIKFRPPLPGQQEQLWTAMQPGAPRSAMLDNIVDETTIDEFAEFIPFTTATIGHETGPIWCQNLTTGLRDLVRVDADEILQSNRASTIALITSPGGGKSSFGKVLAYQAHGRRQSWGAIDRSNIKVQLNPLRHTGEWVKFAEALPPDEVQVIDVAEPPGSMDPLKVWAHAPQTASLRAFALLTELLTLADDEQELALREALNPDNLGCGKIESMMALSRYLKAQPERAAKLVGRKIASWAYNPFAAAVFDESLPALTLTALGTVFRTHGFALPSAQRVFNEHLYKKLQPEERYALAIYPLVVAFLDAAFEQRDGTSWLFIDESWTVTRTPLGHQMMEPKLRDDRKHRKVTVFMSHAGQVDLADDIYKLITIKFLGKAEDRDLAIANLEWFQAVPINEGTIKEVMEMKNGRFFMSMINDSDDVEGDGVGVAQVAEVQSLLPADPRLREALSTTPIDQRKGRE